MGEIIVPFQNQIDFIHIVEMELLADTPHLFG
jgi:hypothetical protein